MNHVILPTGEHKGIRFVHLFESTDAADEGISLTAWDTRGDLEDYEKKGDYQKILAMFTEVLAGAPTLKSYEVTASSGTDDTAYILIIVWEWHLRSHGSVTRQ